MARVRGIGGVFFKSEDPERLYAWYEKHLGIAGRPEQGHVRLAIRRGSIPP